MLDAIHYLPILTTLIAAVFGVHLFQRYRERPTAAHYLWWAIGVAVYGLGTLTEALTTLVGWHPLLFRAWYITGALLGGAPLAQGSVYLHLPRRVADRLTVALVLVVTVAATCVLLSPLDLARVEAHRLSGAVLTWHWVRYFSPFINLYAVIFLIGGAILSALRYRRQRETRRRFIGNVLIAIGATLPGIGGGATRFGHVEVLYVTELIGLVLIWAGYRLNVTPRPGSLPAHAFPGPEFERSGQAP
ncbi:MAG TPA: hypothetical protein VMJ30_03360 [Gemmatimonadales bacterium]|nr:hypothetical protein [Gemmatimonadales bacterium]